MTKEKRIFGGFTDIPWTNHNGDKFKSLKNKSNSFVFRLKDDLIIEKLKHLGNNHNEVQHHEDALCSFNFAFKIYDNCNCN